MEKKRMVAGLIAGLVAWGSLGAPQASAAPNSETNGVTPLAACSLSVTAPYGTSSGKVSFAAKKSGCTAKLDLWLMWVIPGPDWVMSEKKDATSGTTYQISCSWGTPVKRDLYTWAQARGTSAEAISSTKTLTSTTTNCKVV